MRRVFSCIALLGLFAAACGGGSSTATSSPAASASPLPAGVLTHVDTPVLFGQTASIDVMLIDQSAHRLYVADRTDIGVDVLDISTPRARYLRTFLLKSGPNGIALAPDLGKLYSANNDSTVVVFDVTSGKQLATLNTGGKGRADELDYDPKDKKVYVANSADGFVTVIDAKTDTIIKKFVNVSTGSLEQPRYDSADGMFYLSLSDDNAIVQFDPSKDLMTKRWDVGVTCGPQGLAINPQTNQALLGCNNKKQELTVLWDIAAGKVIGTFPQAGAGDVTLYDAQVNRFFFAAANFAKGGAPDPEVAIFSGSPPVNFIAAMGTAVGSHAVAYDETNKVVYTQDQKPSDGGLFAFPLPA